MKNDVIFPNKINNSSVHVLRTLLLLLNNSYTMLELVDKLNNTYGKTLYNNFVVSKYINTCRHFGIEIIKQHNKYYVKSLPFGLNYSKGDSDFFTYIYENVLDSYNSKTLKFFTRLIEKISRYSQKGFEPPQNKIIKINIEKFNICINDNRYVKVIKNDDVFEFIPLSIFNYKGRYYFNILNEAGDEENLAVNEVQNIKISPKKFKPRNIEQTVIFKLKNGLAKRYQARENETIISSDDKCIVISNKGELKEILFSRLLRYDSLCEIISPKKYRQEFITILNNTLKNYEDS